MMTSYIIIIIILIISSWTPLKCVDRDWTEQNCSRSYCKEFHPHTDTIFLSLSLAPLCDYLCETGDWNVIQVVGDLRYSYSSPLYTQPQEDCYQVMTPKMKK